MRIFILISFMSCFCLAGVKQLEVELKYELTFPTMIACWAVDDYIVVFVPDEQKLIAYQGEKVVKEIPAKHGQGPGDFIMLHSLFQMDGKYAIWDYQLKRFTFYKTDWQREREIQKFDNIRYSAPLLLGDKQHIFVWNEYINETKYRYEHHHVGWIFEDGRREVLYDTREKFVDREKKLMIGDRSHLLTAAIGTSLFVAKSQHYVIYRIDLKEKKPSPQVYISRDIKRPEWKAEYYEYVHEFIGEFPRIRDLIRSEYVPPLFHLMVDGQYLAVVTNELVDKKQTAIDFYKGDQFIGQASFPLFMWQRQIMPQNDFLSPGISLKGDILSGAIYDEETDDYKVKVWRVKGLH